MTDSSFDTSGLRKIGADLTGISRRTVGPVLAAFGASAGDLTQTWARNATQTAGKHGKHYPKSIDFEQKVSTNIIFEVGPNPNKPQGGMSFEYGSKNQPPHLDGSKAMDEVTPRLEKRVADALAGVMAVFESGSKGGGLQEYTTKAGVSRMATPAQIANWTRGGRA